MKMNTLSTWILGSTLVLSLAACSTQQRAKTAEVATDGAAAVSEIRGPTENEALHVLTTVNNAEIESAQLAKTKSKDKQVLALADHIIKDHTEMNQKISDLSQRLNMKPEGNAISLSISGGAKATMNSLKNAKGSEFNKAFIAQQVSMHRTALEAIDDNLMPIAKNPEVKTLIESARASVAGHLEHAQQMQK